MVKQKPWPHAIQTDPGIWCVKWEDSRSSWMPDEETAHRCAASGALVEALQACSEVIALHEHSISDKRLQVLKPAAAALALARGEEVGS